MTSFFWCYGERSGNEIRGWASRSMNRIVKTILFKRDGVEEDANVDLMRVECMSQGFGREQVQLI